MYLAWGGEIGHKIKKILGLLKIESKEPLCIENIIN